MATIHLIAGLPCSGKTTYYGVGLQAESRRVLFSLDQWLITTFGQYSIAGVGHEEHVRRVRACRDLIWEAAADFLQRNVDVVLDDGFFLREDRMRYVGLSRSLGAGTRIHYLDTPLEGLRARLEKRNAELPTYNFRIDPAVLQSYVGLFEIPGNDEGAELVVVRSGAGE